SVESPAERLGRGKAFSNSATSDGAFCRASREGTSVGTVGPGCAVTRPSAEKKKKVRSRPLYKSGIRTGPPRLPPKLLTRNGDLGASFASANQSAASNLSFRKYSNSDPEYRFVPDRVTNPICAPGVRPNSGANVEVWILNS